MRNILVLCCAFLFSFCVAIPFVFHANSGNLVAIGNESPHMETPHPAVGSLRDVNSNAYGGQDKRAMPHDARDCLFSTNTQDDGGNDGKAGKEMHNVASRRVNARSNLQLFSRKHNSSVRKGHKVPAAGTSSKPTVVDADGAHWFRQADYRRSPLLGFLQEIGQPSVTSTSSERPNTPTSSKPSGHTEEVKKKPTHSQGSGGSRPDGWEAYRDWKQ